MNRSLIQQQLCDVNACVWVSASAGTGKTKALSDRVLALLVNNIAPESILCLTFTHMAASEMSHRIRTRLLVWARMSPDQLVESLNELLGQPANPAQIALAQTLFDRLVDRMHTLKITTIHGLCFQLLSQFPLEAGIAPHAKVMDDIENTQLLNQALNAVLGQPTGPVLQALKDLSPYVSEERLPFLIRTYLDAIMLQTLATKQRIATEGWLEAVKEDLGWAPNLSGDPEEKDNFMSEIDRSNLLSVAQEMDQSSKSVDQAKSQELLMLLGSHKEPLRFSQIKPVFLTDKGEIRKKLYSSAFEVAHPQWAKVMDELGLRILKESQDEARSKMVTATFALATLTQAFVQQLLQAKGDRLDFTDLIHGANGLLSNAQMAPWVQYKLSQKLSHLLVDEAQDTSPLQWHFIAQLTQDFFTPEATGKTLFVVGDVKQSIYSFQGAFLESFMHFHQLFKAQALTYDKPWWDIDLTHSYRTTAPLLTAIDQVFNETPARRALGEGAPDLNHASARPQTHGCIRVFDKSTKEEGGPHPVEALAATIADHIQNLIASQSPAPGQSIPVKPGDFLILVQQRGPLTQALYRALLSRGLPVSPADRTRLTEHLLIQDLLALGRFILNRADDFSLACLLRSPLCGLDAPSLQMLALDRGTFSLWSHLKQSDAYKSLCHQLETWYHHGCTVPVSDFYRYILVQTQDILMAHHGYEMLVLIDAFLERIDQYEKTHCGLQGFLEWFETVGTLPLKRTLGQEPLDQIRIMTVHGAKGLQAPIVILADATRLPDIDFEFIQVPERNTLMWIPHAGLRTPDLMEAHEGYIQRLYDEYYRLLYVALTRAEDEVWIFGWEDRLKNHPVTSWYECLKGDNAR